MWRFDRWLNETVFHCFTLPIARLLRRPAQYVQVRLWLFGGRNKGHWCATCGSIFHYGIFERLFWSFGAILDGQFGGAFFHQLKHRRAAHINRMYPHPWATLLNPVRTAQQEADLKAYRETGLNPAFRRVVDDINPLAFEAVVDAEIIPWLTRLDSFKKTYAIQLLVGENRTPFGMLHRRGPGNIRCVYTSRASARKARSRYLKRMGIR